MPPVIRGVRARPVLVPIRRPPQSASGAIPEAPLVLIDLETDAHVVGRAYVFAFARWALSPIASCIAAAGEMIRGRALAPLELAAVLRRQLRLIDTPGLLGIALAGLDMAAWDALARLQGCSLARLLGGGPRELRAYNSCGLWIQPVETLPADASALLAEGGFEALKLRVGRARGSEDVEAVRAIRAEVGDAVTLMVDYNQSLNRSEAIERCRALDGEGLHWIEEPIPHEDYEGYASIRANISTPLQTGENLLDARKLERAIALRSLDFVMPDVQRIGGVTGWLRAAAVAEVHDIDVSSHLFPEFSRHLLAVTPTAHWLEYMDWANPLILDPVTVSNGVVRVPDTPGAGIEWDEAAVARHLV